MSRGLPSVSGGQGTATTAGKIGAPSNVNGDRSLKLRPPRIRALNTRNYGKGAPNPYPDQNQTNYGTGVGFGPKQP